MNSFTSAIHMAVEFLAHGGIVALPTEGVFGLSCHPAHLESIKKLCAIKQRDEDKGFVLVGATLTQLEPYIMPLSPAQLAIVQASWPGPITWIVPVKPEVSTLIHGKLPTIAVRVTAHPLLADVCTQLGSAIISTSANKSHEPPAISAEQVKALFSLKQIDYILKGKLGGLKGPTEIHDLSSLTIIRQRTEPEK